MIVARQKGEFLRQDIGNLANAVAAAVAKNIRQTSSPEIFEFAAQQKLPAIYEYASLVRDGGLMSYGPDMGEVYDRAAALPTGS